MSEAESIRLLICKRQAANYTPEQFTGLILRIEQAGFPKWEEQAFIQYCLDQSRYNERVMQQKIKELMNG